MSTLRDVAYRHQLEQGSEADAAALKAVQLWNRMSPTDLESGWDSIAPQLELTVSGAQYRVAEQASPYIAKVSAGLGVTAVADQVAPARFAGWTREGRQIVPDLYGAVTTAKSLIRGGSGVPAAFRAGAGFMAVMAGTLVRDAGRMADSTAGVGAGFKRTVRVISPGACSRCAVLAGREGYTRQFLRHPRCKCTNMPIVGRDVPDGFFDSPESYFDSLSRAEQDRTFSPTGAEAIRLGADPTKVANARRMGRATKLSMPNPNGDGRRRSRVVRLSPEQIMTSATSPAQARVLLKQYGYLS